MFNDLESVLQRNRRTDRTRKCTFPVSGDLTFQNFSTWCDHVVLSWVQYVYWSAQKMYGYMYGKNYGTMYAHGFIFKSEIL